MRSGEGRLRIGVDFHSTIAKIDLPWLNRLNASRGTSYRPEDWSDWEQLSAIGGSKAVFEIQPSAKQWRAFRRKLNQLDVWCWQAKYSDFGVCDGTGWSAEIVYSDRSLFSSGNNCFPGRDGRAISIRADETDNTFEKFCRAVGRLIGREFH
jgi:hypothetical protein